MLIPPQAGFARSESSTSIRLLEFRPRRIPILTIVLRLAGQNFRPVAGLNEEVRGTPFGGHLCPAADPRRT